MEETPESGGSRHVSPVGGHHPLHCVTVGSHLQRRADCCAPLCRDTLSALELERYERQHQHIRDICHLYETDPNNFTRLVDLLQQVGMGIMKRGLLLV